MAQVVDRMMAWQPEPDWTSQLAGRRLASLAAMLTMRQVAPASPPVGVVASIPAAELPSGSVRDCLLHPAQVTKPWAEHAQDPVWADDWNGKKLLFCFASEVSPAISRSRSSPPWEVAKLLNGAFGDVKPHDDPSADDGSAALGFV